MDDHQERDDGGVATEGPTGREGGECMMCKFVLIFSFAVLLLVLLLVFFFRLAPNQEFTPNTSGEISVPNISAFHDRVLERPAPSTTNVVR